VSPRERLARLARALRTAAGLAPDDRATFARAYALQLGYALRSRFRVRRGPWLPERERVGAADAPRPSGPEPEERLLLLFRRAERLQVLGLSCLPRALALGHLLADNGCQTQLVLGVRRGATGIEGHAWRQWGSRVLQGPAFARRFEPLRQETSGSMSHSQENPMSEPTREPEEAPRRRPYSPPSIAWEEAMDNRPSLMSACAKVSAADLSCGAAPGAS